MEGNEAYGFIRVQDLSAPVIGLVVKRVKELAVGYD